MNTFYTAYCVYIRRNHHICFYRPFQILYYCPSDSVIDTQVVCVGICMLCVRTFACPLILVKITKNAHKDYLHAWFIACSINSNSLVKQ